VLAITFLYLGMISDMLNLALILRIIVLRTHVLDMLLLALILLASILLVLIPLIKRSLRNLMFFRSM